LPVSALRPAPWTFHLLHRMAQGISAFPNDPVLSLARILPCVKDLQPAMRDVPDLDVIHVVNLNFPSLAVAAWAEAKRRGCPLMITPFLHVNGERIYPRTVLQQATLVLAQSQVEVAALIRLGVSAKRILLTGVGIDADTARGGDSARFRRSFQLGDEPIVVFVGTASIDKGALQLYQAMKLFWQKGGCARLVMAGRMTRAVDSAIPQDGRVWRLGPVSDDVKRDLLAAAALLVMPSRVESLGIAYLEAWANGLPVIGARVGAVAELIAHNVNGLLVPFGDCEAIAQAIQDLLTDGALRALLGERGRQLVEERYTWAVVLPRILKAYEQALAGRK